MATRQYTAGEDRLIARWVGRGAGWLSRLCGMLHRPDWSIKARVLVLEGRRVDAATDEEDDATIDRRDELTIAIYRAASNKRPRTTERIAMVVGCSVGVGQAELEYLLAGKMLRRNDDGEWYAREGFMASEPADPVGRVYERMARRFPRRKPTTLDREYLYFNEAPCRAF